MGAGGGNGHRRQLGAEIRQSGKVRVYREVEDFRTVDYDAISMLNVSATQELFRLVYDRVLADQQVDLVVAALDSRIVGYALAIHHYAFYASGLVHHVG